MSTQETLGAVTKAAADARGMPFQTAVIIRNELMTLPDVVVVDHETNVMAGTLVAAAWAMAPVTADEVDQANAMFKQIDSLLKAIREFRLNATRPIDAFVSKVIEAERGVTIPLAGAREALGQRIQAATAALNAARQKAVREAEAAAERAAEAERQKRAKEHEAAQAQATADRAALVAKRDREVAMFGESEIVIPGETAIAIPQPAAVVAVIDVSHLPDVPKTKAVRATTKPTLKIDDASKIPREIAGKVLLIPDEKAIKALLDLGIAVPGCRLESVAGIARVPG